ncbi:methionine adenosyltransferase domain-containing protein [Serratia ureilytica]
MTVPRPTRHATWRNIVAAGLADRCEIQVSYAIGVGNRPPSWWKPSVPRKCHRTADAAGANSSICAHMADPDDGSAAADLPRNKRRPLRPRALPWEATDKSRCAMPLAWK